MLLLPLCTELVTGLTALECPLPSEKSGPKGGICLSAGYIPLGMGPEVMKNLGAQP